MGTGMVRSVYVLGGGQLTCHSNSEWNYISWLTIPCPEGGKSHTCWSQGCREELSDLTSLHPHSCIEREEEDGSCPVLEVCACCLSCSTGSRKHWLLTQQPAVIQDSLESAHWYLAEMPWHEWAASVPSSFLCGPRRSNPSWRLAVVTTWERPVLWEVCLGVISQSRSPCGKEVGLILGEPRREGRMNVLAYTNRMYFECRFSVVKCELWRVLSAGGPWRAAVELSWVYGSFCPVQKQQGIKLSLYTAFRSGHQLPLMV